MVLVYLPQVDLVAARSSEGAVVLPGDVHDLTRLLEVVQRLLLDAGGVPDKQSGLVAS